MKEIMQKAQKMYNQTGNNIEKHCREVAKLSLEVAGHLGLSQEDKNTIAVAAYLIDLGKTTWPPELHNKFPLTTSDWALIKAHPVNSENLIKEIWPGKPPTKVLNIVRSHHERPGGMGYPHGLKELDIYTLIVAACDSYVASISERNYRPDGENGKLSTPKALLRVSKYTPTQVMAALGGAVIKQYQDMIYTP